MAIDFTPYPHYDSRQDIPEWGSIPELVLKGSVDTFVRHLGSHNYTNTVPTDWLIGFFTRMLKQVSATDLGNIFKNLPSFSYNLIPTSPINALVRVSPAEVRDVIAHVPAQFDLRHMAALNWNQMSEITSESFLSYLYYYVGGLQASLADLIPIFRKL